MRRMFGGLGFAGNVTPITVSSMWIGNVTASSATVILRSTNAVSVTLRYSTDSGLAGYASTVGSEGNNDQWTCNLSSLSADTRYYVRAVGSDTIATFRTFPNAGAYSFGLAAASCAGHSGGEYVTSNVSNAPTFDLIRARLESEDCIGFLHLGDRHYRDISTNSPSSFRTAYNDVMSASKQNAMHLKGWVDYTWDDHDFGPNDSDASSASKPAAQSTYREHVPHWTLPESDSIHHTYVIGRVRVISLDERSYRSANGATDNSSKTMLGATQKAWFKNLVDTATEPLILVMGGTPWNGDGSWTWGSFSTERTELVTAFGANTAKMIWVHGDNHFLAGDDGTNAPGGIPTFNLAGLDAGHTTNNGTWSTGIFKNEQQQYGTIHFDDDGTNIDVTVRGYSVNSSSVETERFEVVLAY